MAKKPKPKPPEKPRPKKERTCMHEVPLSMVCPACDNG